MLRFTGGALGNVLEEVGVGKLVYRLHEFVATHLLRSLPLRLAFLELAHLVDDRALVGEATGFVLFWH